MILQSISDNKAVYLACDSNICCIVMFFGRITAMYNLLINEMI